MTLPFPFKTKPYDHQLAEYEYSHALVPRGLWWEMGVGKTKPTIDTAAYLYRAGEIQGMAVLAPPGVHENWILDEIPVHLYDEVAENARYFIWDTRKTNAKYFKEAFAEFLRHDGFTVLAMTYYSLMTDAGAKAIKAYLKSRRVLYVADEATRFSKPGAKTTKRTLASSAYAPYRRVLNGTPVSDSPFQAYSQVRFVDMEAWKREFGIKNYEDFKAFFGRWERRRKGKHEWPQLLRYRNLELMHKVVDATGSRLLKKDVLDLPPKTYKKIYFDISVSARRMYDQLVADFRTEFEDGAEVTTELAIVRMTRLQQIASGYLPADDEDHLRPLADKNPRADIFREIVEDIPRKAIIWNKYNIDVDETCKVLQSMRKSFVVYDGRTSTDDRQAAKAGFQKGDVQFFVSKPSAAGRGLTLTAADTVVYYSNGFSLDDRLQSEGRPDRIGQTRSVNYIDIVARDTIDERILESYRTKRELAAIVTGDDLDEWI